MDNDSAARHDPSMPHPPLRLAVVGGTGLVGRLVVDAARAAGHDVTVIARSTGVDLTTGAGLDAALAGCQAVVDAGNVVTTRAAASTAYFEAATTRLVRAAADAGVRHLVVLSIVGVDRVDLGYYLGKRRQEEIALASSVPTTVLRATQFHEFAGQVLGGSRGPLALVPRMRTQPVAAREVAAMLLELAAGEPQGLGPELAGPGEHELVTMARRVVKARGPRWLVVPVRLPGAVGRGLAGGGLLPTGPVRTGTETFDEWLARG